MTEQQRVITDELLKGHERTNDAIAEITVCSNCLVGIVRRRMEKAGAIQKWRGTKGCPSIYDREAVAEALLRDGPKTIDDVAGDLSVPPHIVRSVCRELDRDGHNLDVVRRVKKAAPRDTKAPKAPRPAKEFRFKQAVENELIRDYERANPSIAWLVGCTPNNVLMIRHALEREGKIAKWRGNLIHPRTLEVVDALLADHERYNVDIALVLSCSQETVRRTRCKLELGGQIPKWRGRPDIVADIRGELLNDYQRINKDIADVFGCTDGAVRSVRLQLERDGDIPVWRGSSGGNKTQHTYIVQGRLTGKFKVGKAKDVVKRVKDMQVGSPDTLDVVAILDGSRWEKVLHGKLEPHHSHGEWFEWNDESSEIVSATIKEAKDSQR